MLTKPEILLIWKMTHAKISIRVFGIYTAMGDVRQVSTTQRDFHESLASIGSVMGASLVGIDKSNQKEELCWDVKKLLTAIQNGILS
jgi:hypothetical protein